MLTFKMAFRNILRQKRRTIFTALTMLGGFTLAAISIGWADGTYGDIIDLFTRNRMGHIQVHAKGYLDNPSLYKTVDNCLDAGKKIESVRGVECWAPRLYAAGLVSAGEKSGAARIIGIDPRREHEATAFNRKVTKGSPLSAEPAREALAGAGLARSLGAKTGDTLVIVSQAADGSIANDAYRLAGIVESGDEIDDRIALYLHLAEAQELFVLEGRAHEIAIIGKRSDRARTLSTAVAGALDRPELSVEPWQVFARPFYSAMQADKQGMYIFLFVIILIVSVGVLNTVLMAVLERRREYGLLRAVGTRPGQIFRLILTEITIITAFSIAGGIVLGLIANYILSVTGFSLPEPISYGGMEFQTMRAEINARSFFIPALVVFFAAVLVSFFPALKAARTDPAASMRIH